MIVSKITNEIVFQNDDFGKNATMIGLCNDHVNNMIWIHSTKNLFYMSIENENKNVWIAYVKKRKLNLALQQTIEGSENHALV